ncbi:putative nucleotidyltransferase/HEPN domain-containing protein [Rhizobium petrolearium]|uniref:HEPN domain-containing protein n=1 Tax=Neorhizobium petrolearium TaxID=515361 RepID=A0ABY8LY55_9HYPH|nr:HEPN domain-containing protein [Neorhizobium petrolearium]MBP1847649.1 putative nucleotidyltransferase/HEPN domain-containing protein [Neorhizobium petrolearium]MCC2611072.1 HEPN domain-containing protein [Neorhizobium petrolearium]WGI66289.1 HEPN domain-containing protein [Neorhizobium petrolearium]
MDTGVLVTDNNDGLGHLPERKQRELSRALKIIFEEFEAAQQSKLSEKKKAGRILKVILFGSHARGDWVEDRKSGYRSDYDILVVVNMKSVGEDNDLWHEVSDHFLRELTITKEIETPVNIIVHTLQDVNDQLARGRPFFIDIIRDGIMLYEKEGHPFVTPRLLSEDVARKEAQGYFEKWFPAAGFSLHLGQYSLGSGQVNHAAFNLHQATEQLYHCALLVLTLYSPKSHRLKFLRSSAERIDPRLIEAWPRDTKFARRCFERLDRAYVDARYSPHYEITEEELEWLIERIQVLQGLVRVSCEERLMKIP